MHLSYHEHTEVYSGLCNQQSKRAIARSLNRAPSTVTREIRRNSDKIGYLSPLEAYRRQQEKRGNKPTKISLNPELQTYIIEKLKLRWGPKVIAASWNKQGKNVTISHESLYTWLYNEADKDLKKLLPRAKPKRGLVRKKPKKSKIPDRVGIEKRPKEIEDRSTPGHFEADLVFNKGSMSSNTLTAIERKSRYVILVKNDTKQSSEVIDGLDKRIQDLEVESITFDNGSEFTRHSILKDKLQIDTYFCDPGKPWQKGSIEHFNGMLRHRIPFNTPPEEITQELLDSVAYDLNHMPRESLNFLTPCEVFSQSRNSGFKGCCCRSKAADTPIETEESRMKSPGRRQRPFLVNQKKVGVAFYS